MAITIGLCVLGCYGTTLLEVEFRYVEFLPQDTNLYKWFHLHNTYFPGDGEMGTVYFSEMDLYKYTDIEFFILQTKFETLFPYREFPKIKSLVEKFQNRTDIIFSVDSWYHDFEDYLNNNFLDPQHPLPNHPISEVMFHEKLTQFLFSPSGAKHMNKFKFENEIKCGVPSSKVMVSFDNQTQPNNIVLIVFLLLFVGLNTVIDHGVCPQEIQQFQGAYPCHELG